MAVRMASRLKSFFEERTNGELRSIIKYEQAEFEPVYVRDDVEELYTDAEFSDAVDESRMESMYASIYESTFSDEHGGLQCNIACFENVVEMNFALDDGIGVAVALDEEAMTDTHGMISAAREIVIEERGDR